MSKTITVSDETYESIKGQLTQEEKVDVSNLDDFIGKKLFIRTVTYFMVGKVVKRVGNMFEMENASWVADTGRFMNAIKDGTLSEVEPVGQTWVNFHSVVDMFPWTHDLPTKQK
jgi:hypothetical protein